MLTHSIPQVDTCCRSIVTLRTNCDRLESTQKLKWETYQMALFLLYRHHHHSFTYQDAEDYLRFRLKLPGLLL